MTRSVLAALAGLVLFCAPAHAGDISPQANQEYLAANAAKAGVVVRPSGLQYRVIKAGTGRSPEAGDVVTVSYRGQLVDGYVFDETKPGRTAKFVSNRVVSGWVEALSLMKEGDEWEIVFPASLGYGAQGSGSVPSNQALTFNVQLIAVEKAPQQ